MPEIALVGAGSTLFAKSLLGDIVSMPELAGCEIALKPTRIGRIPPQLAALMQTNINVQALTVEASLTGEREHVYHAATPTRRPRSTRSGGSSTT